MTAPRTDVPTGEAHLDYLVNRIGPRPAASPAHHQAEAYIRNVFLENHLAVEEVRLDFPNWSLQGATLTVNGAPLDVDVNPFSPACDVAAPLVALSTLPELEAAELRGRNRPALRVFIERPHLSDEL